MMTKSLLLISALLLLMTGSAFADAHNPTVAILSFGTLPATEAVKDGVIDVLQSHGLVSADERAMLAERVDIQGERLNILWGDADFQLPDANLILENALDQGVDVLVTISAPMTQLAVNATNDMENPPDLIFTSVYDPYAAGIAEAPCIKPDHVTGVGTPTPYDQIVGLLRIQAPEMRVIGTIFDPSESSSQMGAESIAAMGAAMGFQVEVAAAASLADVGIAAESLVAKGAQAIVVPLDNLVHRALPLLSGIADENDLLLFAPSSEGAYFGAAIGAGPSVFYRRGTYAGYILAAHLNGDADIASLAIDSLQGMGIGINFDAADQQSVVLSEQIIDWAGLVIEDGELRMTVEDMSRMTNPEELSAMVAAVKADGSLTVSAELEAFVAQLEPPDFAARTADYLAELVCTPEMIAEQQAELEAGGD